MRKAAAPRTGGEMMAPMPLPRAARRPRSWCSRTAPASDRRPRQGHGRRHARTRWPAEQERRDDQVRPAAAGLPPIAAKEKSI